MTRTYEPFRFLGRFTVIPLRAAPGTSLVSFAPTWEVEAPYRYAPTFVFRLPFGLALGIGWWLDTEVDDLTSEYAQRVEIEAANAAYDAYVAVNGNVDRGAWDAARAKIAALGLDPDEEMALMQAEGVFE